MAKGVADARHGKGLSKGEANENERRGHTETSYRRLNEKALNNYDWSRHGLNFEIVKGKIVPLGSQKKSMYFRYLDALKNVDFKTYKDGATNRQNTYAGLIFSGSTAHMQRIAFGDQKVDYTRNPEQWRNWGVTRTKAIEDWAMDTYNFACEMYGEENILGFDVHLDETAPHIHCKVVPTAIKQQRGNISGYHKVDADGNPITYQKGKHIGEVIKISDKKYAELSEEKKKEYRPNVRGTVKTISYASYFGRTLAERAEKLSELHTKYYEAVGKKWGLERGDVIADLPEEEQRKRRHRTKEEAYRESKAKKARELAEQEAKAAEEKVKVINDEVANQKAVMASNAELLSSQTKEIQEKGAELQQINANTEKAKKAAVAAVEATQEAVAERDNALKERDESKAEVERNEKTINTQVTVINQNNTTIAKQEETKAEMEKKINLMSRIENITYRGVDSYVKDLKGVQIELNKDIRSKLISPLKNHPRIQSTNPPLTAEELERIALEEESKVINRIGGIIGISKNKANEEIRAIRTDVQTIYFSVVSAKQKKGIKEANENIYKTGRRELAEVYKKAEQYDKLEKAGVNLTSYENMKEKAKEAEKTSQQLLETEQMLEYAWPGVTRAKNVLIDPALDENFMDELQKKDVLGALRDNPNHPEYRLEDIMKLQKYACSFQDVYVGTRAEAIELAAENIIKDLAEKGYDLIKEATALVGEVAKELEMTVSEAAKSTASAAVCLIYGYLDAATTVSQGCGGGGGSNNDLPKKKDDEDMRSFYGRCLNAAAGMMRPKNRQIQSRGGYRR